MFRPLYAYLLGCAFLLAALTVLSSTNQQPSSQSVATRQVRFVDAAKEAGLTVQSVNGGEHFKKYIFESTGSGIAAFDYDRDGFPDIFLVNGSRLEGFAPGATPINHLFHNNRDGTFSDVTAPAGLSHSGWGQGTCVGDYDNDGYDDLFVTYFDGPNILYHNNGNGTFTDVTKPAGLYLPGRNWSTGCAFLDYDHDGKVDLFVASYVDYDKGSALLPGSGPNCFWKDIAVFCGPRGLPFGDPHLYHNNGDGTFTDVSVQVRIHDATGCYGLGVLTADFENRGRPDIYVACDSTASLLYRNNGDGTFTERAIQAGVAYNEDGMEQAGMGVSAGDYDGDGFLDILKTNFENDFPDLYRNKGDGTFTLMTYDAKLGYHTQYLGWGGGFLDYDNDGWPDLLIVNGHVYPELETHNHPESPYRQKNLLYHNAGNGTFEEVTSIAGPGFEGRRSGRGAAFADFNNDGAIGVVINNQNDPPTFLLNKTPSRNRWVSIRTVGTKSNRDGIGARIILWAEGRGQIQEVRSGGSYLSQNDLRVHFGVGGATRMDALEIHWPSGSTDRMKGLSTNQFLVVEEGKGIVSRK